MVAINVGGPAYVASNGIKYVADQYFTGGYVDGITSGDIANTIDDTIYKTERWGDYTYNIPVANGRYDVTLQFSELSFYYPGDRIFSVNCENLPIIQNLDIFKTVGASKVAYDKIISGVQVSDWQLSLHFYASVDAASVSGIVVKPAGGNILLYTGAKADISPPTAPSNLKAIETQNRQLTIGWGASSDDVGVYQYVLFRDNVQIALVDGSTTSYVDGSLKADTTYRYVVKAIDKSSNESVSVILAAKTYVVSGPVTLAWGEPSARTDGERLYKTDIGGYKIRYKLASATSYTTVDVAVGATSYSFANLVGDYIFEMATYDVNGFYSEYVKATLK